jgi:hypothetical protein
MYFTNVQKLYYPFNINNKQELIVLKDITHNVRFKEIIKDKITSYEYYTIQDGDTPEIISEKIYGTPNYHWTIMLLNDRFDYLTDFPIPIKVFDKYVKEKYDDIYGIHHCQKIVDGIIIKITTPEKVEQPAGYPSVTTSEYTAYLNYISSFGVTNYDYETTLNEEKRNLKYIPADIISYIIKEINDL